MVSFPEDFWEALKSGNTSDWLFWVDIGIIIGALFVLLCFMRCCMWCCWSKKNDEKYDASEQDAKLPPAWLNNQQHYQPQPDHYQLPQDGYMCMHQPHNPHGVQTSAGSWHHQHQHPHAPPQYNHNSAYSHHARPDPAQYQYAGSSMHGYQQGPYQGHQPSANAPHGNGQGAVHPVAPHQPPTRKDHHRAHHSPVRWSKEDFDSVFSDQNIVQGSSEPPADMQLANGSKCHPAAAGGALYQQQLGRAGAHAHPSHAHASPYGTGSPSRRDSPSNRRSSRPPHVPSPSPFSPISSKPSAAHDRPHGSMNSGGDSVPPMHEKSSHSTPPGHVPSKLNHSNTPSPSEYTPSDIEGGVPGRDTMHVRNSRPKSDGRDRRNAVPKLQPPLPVSPRVASLLDNALVHDNTACSGAPPLLPDVGTGMEVTPRKEGPAQAQPHARSEGGAAGTHASPGMSPQEHPGRALRMKQATLASTFGIMDQEDVCL